MCADVNQWSAALFIFVGEYAPVGNSAAAQRMGFCHVYLTEFTGLRQFFQSHSVFAVAVLVADGQ